jgi:adenine-specific DNA-methyltransferase
MQNLYKNLETLLKSDERFVSKDGKDLLLKNLIQQKASEMDADLIKLLLSEESLKKHFFSEIEQMLIFDKAKFIDFIYNKEFLKDSYTMFANKIGLMDDKQFMKEQKEVVLARPYKDCILE